MIHLTPHKPPKKGGYFCPDCGERFVGAWAAAKHAKETGHGQQPKENAST